MKRIALYLIQSFLFFNLVTVLGCMKAAKHIPLNNNANTMVGPEATPIAGVNGETGGVDPVTHSPYTASSPDEVVVPQVGANLEPSHMLGSILKDFSVSFTKPQVFSLRLNFSENNSFKLNKKILLEGSLTKGKANEGAIIGKAQGSGLEVNLVCADILCQKTTILLKSDEAQITLVQRNKKADVEWRGNLEVLKSIAPKQFDKNKNLKEIFIISKEVSWGFSRVLAFFPSSLCFSSDLISTSISKKEIQFSCEKPIVASNDVLQAELAGNTNQGSWLFRWALKSQTAPIFLRLSAKDIELSTPVKPGADTNKPGSTTPAAGPVIPSIIPTLPAQPKPPTTPQTTTPSQTTAAGQLLGGNPVTIANILVLNPKLSATQIFERGRKSYDYKKLIEKRIALWTTGSERGLAQNFIKNIVPRLKEIIPYFNQYGVPHQFIFPTLWESHYFSWNGYPVEPGSSGEVGPWQFMYDTADWDLLGLHPLNLIVTPSKKVPNKCDDRGHLEKSSLAAAKYWKYLLSLYPLDPELSILSYNWGSGNLKKSLTNCYNLNKKPCEERTDAAKDIKELKKAGYNFWVIEAYKMAPESSIEYVIKVMAAYFMFKDYKKYNFEVPALPAAKYKDTWLNGCSVK